jgi:CDP-diacylglycerol--serine O-phosphatidyltransferase
MRPARREIALIQLLPNVMTLGALCAGLTAMRFAVAGAFDLAVALLVLAAILDALDGRVARVLNSESLIGAELDSLADVVNFGVAPALILYFHTLWREPVSGWIVALVYVVCCALRLARFNVGAKTAPAADRRFFTGVPSPAGALLALAPLFLAEALPAAAGPAWMAALWLAGAGLLMVSRLPTFSLKVRIPRAGARLVLLAMALAAAFLALAPWHALLVFDLLYLAAIPAAVLVSRSPAKE